MYRSLFSSLDWKQRQALHYFPYSTDRMYRALHAAGFDPQVYRSAWPDLVAALADDSWSAPHFLEFMDAEAIVPRAFPIELNIDGLREIAGLTWLSKRKRATILRSLIQTAVDFRPQSATDPMFWRLAFEGLAEVAGLIIVFGDSHSRIFRQTIATARGPVIVINVLCGGGSAGGLPNKNSLSGYGDLVEQSCAAIESARGARQCQVCLKFGQVDLEFVLTYRRARRDLRAYDRTYALDFNVEVATKYVEWIARLPGAPKIVIGVNPPCLTDEYLPETYTIQAQTYTKGRVAEVSSEQLEQTIANFRNLEFPNQRERTDLHRRFNNEVSARARGLGVGYVDNYDVMLDESGCLQPRFAQSVFEGSMKVGFVGKDIHLGGPDAIREDAALLARIFALA